MTASRHLQRNDKALPRLGESIDANALNDQPLVGRDGDQPGLLACLTILQVDDNACLERLCGGACTKVHLHIVSPFVGSLYEGGATPERYPLEEILQHIHYRHAVLYSPTACGTCPPRLWVPLFSLYTPGRGGGRNAAATFLQSVCAGQRSTARPTPGVQVCSEQHG